MANAALGLEGDPIFAERFRHAGRPGIYCQVIRQKHVAAGETPRSEPYTGLALGVLTVVADIYATDWDKAR